jgi:hypothetical protein
MPDFMYEYACALGRAAYMIRLATSVEANWCSTTCMHYRRMQISGYSFDLDTCKQVMHVGH